MKRTHVLSVANALRYYQSATSAHRLSGGFVCCCLLCFLAVGFLGCFDMEPWKPGLMALFTMDEIERFEQDTKCAICLHQAIDNEERAADVADKAIMRMIGQ
jgi:hypothetical protein